MNNDNLKSLRQTLLDSGYDTPEYDVFAKDMEDEENLKGVYETLKKEGYTPPEYDEFKRDMGWAEPAKPYNPSEDTMGAGVGAAIGNAIANPQPQQPQPEPQPKAQPAAKQGGYTPTWQEQMAMGITASRAAKTAKNATSGIDQQVQNQQTYQENVFSQTPEIGRQGHVVSDGEGYITDDATKHNVLVDANKQQQEADSYLEAMRKQREEYTEPTLWDSVSKSIGSGFIRVGTGILNSLQQLSSGMIVEDASKPTGYTKTQSYDEQLKDKNNAITRGINSMHETADRLSRQAQPRNGKGFLDMLWDGDISGFLQKGVATAGESLPMTLSAFNPYTMVLNGISLAGNNYREQTLENPDIPEWKRFSMAVGSAAIEQAVEKYADPVFKYIGGGKILKKAGKEASEEITKEVTKKATENLAKRIYKGMGGLTKDAAGEGIEEVVTNFGNDALGEILDKLSRNDEYGLEAQWAKMRKENPNATLWDFAQQKAKENVESFIGGAMAGAYTSGTTQLTTKGIEYGLNHMLNEQQIVSNPNAQLNPASVDIAQSFDEGYTLDNEQDIDKARAAYEEQRQRATEIFGEIRGLDEQPLKTIETMQQGGFTPEQIQAAYDYISAKATFDGVQQRMTEDTKRSRVDSYNVSGNTIEELDSEGNVIGTHEYENQDEMKLGLFELQQTRANNDMQADISMMRLNPKYDYDTALASFAEEAGVDPDYIESVVNTDPMERTEAEQQMVSEFAETIHNILYDNTTLHEDQSAEDGADLAEMMGIDLDGADGTQAQQITDSYNAATVALNKLFDRNEDLKQEVQSREKQGMPHQGIIASLDSFRPEDVQTVTDFYNQQAKFNGFLNRMSQKIGEEAANRRQRHTLNGTINGQADVRNVHRITDGTNTYYLVSGNITTDSSGRITDSDSGLIIGMDEDGNFVNIGDTNGYSVMPVIQSLDQWEEGERTRLQEEWTAKIDPTGSMMQPQPVPETAETGTQEAESVPQTEGSDTQRPILSDETNEYGKRFVISGDGSTTFGAITPESGLTPAPLKLSEGEDTVDEEGNHHGYGLAHIEAERGDQIRKAGYNSVQEFVETVGRNWTDIREGNVIAGNQTYLIELTDEHNNTLFVQLSKDGSYWNINSAGIFRKKYSRKKPEVYSRPALGSSTSTDATGVNHGLSEGATVTSGDSPLTSVGKDTNNSDTSQVLNVKVDKNGVKLYEEGTPVDQAIQDIQNDGFDVDEMADAHIAEAQEAIDKINKKETKKPQDLIERKRQQGIIDYYNDVKSRYAELNQPAESEENVNVQSEAPNNPGNDVPLQEKKIGSKPKAKTVDEKRADRVKALKEQYGDDFDDDFTKAHTAEELASMYVGRNRTLSRESIAEALGYPIGINTEEAWAETLLAKKGEGMSTWDVAHAAWQSDENPIIDNEGNRKFNDQEIHDALISVFQNAKEKSDIMDFAVNGREEEARRLAEGRRRQEEEQVENAEQIVITDEEMAAINASLPFSQPTDEEIPEDPNNALWSVIREVTEDGNMPPVRLVDTAQMTDRDWANLASQVFEGAFVEREEVETVRSIAMQNGVVGDDNTGVVNVFSGAVTPETLREKLEQIKELYNGTEGQREVYSSLQESRDSDNEGARDEVQNGAQQENPAAEAGNGSENQGSPESVEDSYLQPRNAEEEQIIANVLAQLQQEIGDAVEDANKARAELEKARAKESDRATDMFANDQTFAEPDAIFSQEEMGLDTSAEGVERRTAPQREKLQEATNKLNRLQSLEERNSRVRGALDNERRQTSFDEAAVEQQQTEPSEDPMKVIEETANEFKEERKEEQKQLGITTDETPQQKADRERAEKLADTPLTDEEVDSSSASDVQKTLAKAYLNGNHGILQEAAYLNVYNDVRNRRQDDAADSRDADGAQLVGTEDIGESGSGRVGGQSVGLAETESSGQDEGRQLRVEDGEGQLHSTSGERGDRSVRVGESSVDGVSSGGVQSVGGGRTRIERSDVRGAGAKEGGSGDTGKPAAGSDAAIAASKQRLAELRKKFKDAGKRDLSISLVGMNNEQIGILGEIITESANLGYQYLNRGMRDFNEWRKQMLSDFKDWLQEDFHWTDADVEEYLREVWNCEYNIDGVTRTIGEWASFIGNKEIKKIVKEDRGTKFEQQKAAESVDTKVGDIDNIRESLPFLLPEQQDDVLKAETQFFNEQHQDREHGYGKGMMFTNGTGTGKTYTGLGIVKRFVKQGKGRVLILTPSQEKVSDWRKDGLNLGLDIESLDEEAKIKGTSATKSKGKGVVVTTYANARQNLAMLEDCFDLIVYDESHKIMENKEAANTTMMDFHEMLTNKNVERSMDRQTYWLPEWVEHRNLLKEREDTLERLEELQGDRKPEAQELEQHLNVRLAEITKRLEELRPIMQEIRESKRPQAEIDSKRTKTVFLSATPFNKRESMRYAEGYIFSYPEEDKNTIGTYNHRSPEDAFLEQMFPAGYRWRYGRLESHVSNAEALGRQEIDFSDYMQNTLQTMSGRMISSDYDYSRDFPVMTLDHAGRFNQAMSEVYRNKRYQPLAESFRKAFDYNYSTALFEAMKTSLVNERIKEHLKRGQKVVVFHRRRTSGDLEPPFRRALEMARAQASMEQDGNTKTKLLTAIKAFEEDFADMLEWEKTLDYTLPREQIEKVFGKDKVAFFSGAETKKTKHKSVEEFMKDNGGKDIIVIQEASGKEGISLHDQTGEHQRVEINLALPQSPIAFIQIEGRIYRIGQKSNAIFEYPLLGLDLETNLFAQKFNGALGTTENLALGSKARNLRKSIANSVLENTGEVDYDRQGLGGKDMDGRVDQAGDKDGFDISIQDYYGNQKMQRGRDNREGVDYFPTPEPIGYKMVEWGQMMDGETALEPSAGHGAIARYVPETNGMTAIEPSSSLFTKLQMRAGGPGRRFEEMPFEDYPLANKHDVVLMNPPYGVQGKTAMEHVVKAFKHLNEGGRVIAIIPDGPAMEKRLDAWLADKEINGAAVVTGEVKLPSVAFGRAGTNVRTRIVVIDKVSRAQMREKMPQKVTVDLSGEESIGGLFDRIRDVRMPERTIDQAAINEKRAKRTERQFDDNPFVSTMFIGQDYRGNSIMRIGTRGSSELDMDFNLARINEEDVLFKYEELKKYRDNPEKLDFGRWITRSFGSGKNRVPALDAIRDYCETAIKTLENLSRMTADQMDKAARTMREEAERRRQEREAEEQRLRDEREQKKAAHIKEVTEVALAENKDNGRLTPAGIEVNMKIAHGNIYLMAEKSKRILREAGIDWETGHKINKNEPVNARTSTVVQPQPTQRKADYEYKLDKHTRTGEDMHLVVMNKRVDDNTYKELERKAKALNGYYNRIKRAWHFKGSDGEANAKKFAESLNEAGQANRMITTHDPMEAISQAAESWRQQNGKSVIGKVAQEIKDFVDSLPTRFGLNGGAPTYVINSREDLEALKGKVKDRLWNEIDKLYKEPDAGAAYIPRYGICVVFGEKLEDTKEGETAWWHEQAHGFWQKTPEDVRKKYGEACLEYLRTNAPSLYNHIKKEYPMTDWLNEACSYLIGEVIRKAGTEKFLAANFVGNEEICNFANELRNYIKNGTRESNNQLRRDAVRGQGSDVQRGDSQGRERGSDSLRAQEESEEVTDPLKAIELSAKRWKREKRDQENGENTPLHHSAKALYDERLNRVETVFSEAYQDAMVSLKTAQNAIAGDKEIPDSQNAYMAENLMHGKNKNEMDLFNRMFRDPLIQTINKIMNLTGMNWGDIDRYVYTKSGLERNREFFVRDWLEAERKKIIKSYEDLNPEEQEIFDRKADTIETLFEDGDIETEEQKEKELDKALQESHNEFVDDMEQRWQALKRNNFIDLNDSAIDFADYIAGLDNFIRDNIDESYVGAEHDYSGFRAMYGDEDGKYDEDEIINELMNNEDMMEAENVDTLWNQIRECTMYGLERYREAGMRTDEQIDRVEQMFHWYVPMRGFKDNTGEDMYQYFTGKDKPKSYVGGLLKHAKGRGSEANYPISTIFSMTYKAISDCNQNLVNQKFYRLCQANPNDLVILSDSWAVLNETTGEWEEVAPDIPEDADEEDVRQITEAWEESMRQLANEGKAKKIKGKEQFDYKPMDKKKQSEHIVDVRINGQPRKMIVTGNPRMAQALNGQLRFENGKNVFSKWNSAIKNFMASVFTSYSPTFALRNMFRDWTHFRTMLGVREGRGYASEANKYYRQSLFKMVGLFKKYRNGTLDESNEMERDFKDFMDNGGITGFVFMQKIDDIQKEMENFIKKQKAGKTIRLNNNMWEKILGAVEALNEGIENNARFATYRASRHYAGRTKARSAYDAKEITVNFNRKGAGAKTAGFKSQRKVVEDAAKVFGITSQILGEGQIFFNAVVQAIATTFKNFQNADGSLNKPYIAKWAAKYALPPFLFGLALPMINKALAAALGGDDGDDDPYANLPEWTRRKNLCFYIGNGNFITIPIGQELAAFLTLGDIMAGNTYAPDLKPVDRSWDDEILGVMNTFSPVDVDTKITKGGLMEDPISEVTGRTFSVLAPLVAVEQNLGWTGRPIYREDIYPSDKYNPEYQMVYRSTNPVMVGASKLANDLSGGDDVVRGKIQVNPAIVQYLWEQYTGGPGKVFSNTISIGKDAKDILSGDESDFNIRKVEGLKAFVQQGDDRTAYYRTQAKYRKYLDDAKKLRDAVNGYKKAAETDPLAPAKLEKISASEDYVRMERILEADKELSKINKAANKAEGQERRELRRQYNQGVKEVVDELDKIQ